MRSEAIAEQHYRLAVAATLENSRAAVGLGRYGVLRGTLHQNGVLIVWQPLGKRAQKGQYKHYVKGIDR